MDLRISEPVICWSQFYRRRTMPWRRLGGLAVEITSGTCRWPRNVVVVMLGMIDCRQLAKRVNHLAGAEATSVSEHSPEAEPVGDEVGKVDVLANVRRKSQGRVGAVVINVFMWTTDPRNPHEVVASIDREL